MATVRVTGIREVQSAFRKAEGDLDKEMRAALKKAGELVRPVAQSLFSGIDEKSAGGYKVKVRARGVSVEQTLRRTTGEHPQFGAMQMAIALIPALDDKESEVVHELELMLDHIGRAAGF